MGNLPIVADGLSIRLLTRADMRLLCEWPPYPRPYGVFRFSFSGQSVEDLDRTYEARMSDESRITLVADTAQTSAIGYIALVGVDWKRGICGNMAIRIRSDYCDRGIGSRVLREVRDWWFGHGMNLLRLDVAATNHRAIRCYLNVGYHKTGEFWRDAEDLVGENLSDRKYRFLGDDVDDSGATPKVRFYWMEVDGGRVRSTVDRSAP